MKKDVFLCLQSQHAKNRMQNRLVPSGLVLSVFGKVPGPPRPEWLLTSASEKDQQGSPRPERFPESLPERIPELINDLINP